MQTECAIPRPLEADGWVSLPGFSVPQLTQARPNACLLVRKVRGGRQEGRDGDGASRSLVGVLSGSGGRARLMVPEHSGQ
jgi:hypothetical protein